MKNWKKIITLLFCLFLLTGCDFYVYSFDTGLNKQEENTSNLAQSGSGTTIITDNINYTGLISYTNNIPTSNTSWDEVYDKVKSSVVTVRNVVNGNVYSTGSGVFFANDSMTNGFSYIFTNAHVVEGSTSIEILLSNGVLVKGTLVGYDRNEDVAVIQIVKRNDYTIATLRNSDTLKIGESVLTVGSPLGEKYSETATSGIISNLNISLTPDNSSIDLYLIQIDAALNPGNSGGPLFDNAGNLIGINTIKLLSSGSTTNIESFNYSIPISHFSLVASYLLQGSLYYRPLISISVSDIRYLSFSEREKANITINHGLLIVTIDQISPLYTKTEKGKIITHIENIEVLKASDFSVELLKHAPDETITLTICDPNGSNSQDVEITLLKR